MERDQSSFPNVVWGGHNFNSRAHVERDAIPYEVQENKSKISTHALTWSATVFNCEALSHFLISTHALTWSAT